MASMIREVSPGEAQELVARQEAVLIDVREPDEWEEARIPGARLIPLGELNERLAELPRDRALVMQCRSGARSRGAAEALVGAGYERVLNLRGGILAWARAGLPVEARP